MQCFCCQSNKSILELIGQKQYHKCRQCGFMFASSKAYKSVKNKVVSHYQDCDPHEKVATSKQSFFRWTLDYLSSEIKTNQRSILDVGCGYGYFLELASKNDWNTYGVEIVGSAVEVARKRLGENSVFHGPLVKATYPDEYFDAVTLWDVLVLVECPIEELKECYRILKQRGKIGIRVRNVLFQKTAYKIYLPFRHLASWLNIKKPYVFHRYNFHAKSLRLLLERAGFSSIQITNSPLTEGDPYSHARIDKFTSALKCLADTVARSMFQMSGGRLITGPSLLVWAEKL